MRRRTLFQQRERKGKPRLVIFFPIIEDLLNVTGHWIDPDSNRLLHDEFILLSPVLYAAELILGVYGRRKKVGW